LQNAVHRAALQQPGNEESLLMNDCWMAVASAAHVRIGRAQGFMQVGHGKAAPLRRIKPGDRIVYYSPTVELGGKDKLQAFTAIGVVQQGEPYEGDMGGGFRPFRRDVTWLSSIDAPIQPLLDRLEFSAGVRNWGVVLRRGLVSISEHDMDMIASAMRAAPPA
jgi:EVE domain